MIDKSKEELIKDSTLKTEYRTLEKKQNFLFCQNKDRDIKEEISKDIKTHQM